MGQMLPEAAIVFINSFEELDPIMTNDFKFEFKQYLNVGLFILAAPPPSVPNSYDCLTWLDKQKSATMAYISFGLIVIPPPNELVALEEALKARTNGIVVPWAPQIDALAHGVVGVFINHGGYNSLLESIAGGVPRIVRPFFGDHKLNGRIVEDVWEIGVIVKGGIFSKNGIMSSLDVVLAQEKGKKMREVKQSYTKSSWSKRELYPKFQEIVGLVCT
ncbi:hypothetical protein CRYUN_Cryun16bG0053000 [Craigia yunnanensis]